MINDKITGSDSHSNVYYAIERLPLIAMLDRPPGRVLEIGCGTGLSLKYLKQQRGAAKTIGVELRSDIADAAMANEGVDKVYNLNFIQEDLPEDEKPFDTIILSHVLEHFPEPSLILNKIKKHLNSNARLLIAVPNIRHWSVVLPLMFQGDFNYADSGILDYTHLRFFTKSSAMAMIEDNGYKVLDCQMEINGPKSTMLSRVSFGLADDFAAYAINIVAELDIPQ
jgi:2-polyprenyl-3-methyl-5-hydroxy-6-metoxy-1,4-benzoquinol methylase